MAAALAASQPAHAASDPLMGLDLGCAEGYALVNLRPNAGGPRTSTSLSGLTINGGSTQSVPVSCTPSPTPSGTPPLSGDGHVLLGGRVSYTGTAAGTPTAMIFANGSSSVTSANIPVTVGNGWTDQARADALAVSSYIGSFGNSGACTGITGTACNYATISLASGSTRTLTGIGGLNFYDVSSFGSNVQLNFVGNPNDFFVFNVPTSSIVTNRGWTISGLAPSQILFNLIGQGQGVSLEAGANALGTFLVSSNTNAGCTASSGGNTCNGGTVTMASNTSLYGSLIVINNDSPVSFGSGSVIHGTPFNPTRLRQVPVPGPLPVLGAATAFGWSRRLRRRLKRAHPALQS
ncbi:MAG: hypothetical protein ER33_04035 [Cyanobium sp. CACIAM 14]|nr:MAG: hypothetical protein ER33_04035 [Cyanobium sp. CACIAM 14]